MKNIKVSYKVSYNFYKPGVFFTDIKITDAGCWHF